MYLVLFNILQTFQSSRDGAQFYLNFVGIPHPLKNIPKKTIILTNLKIWQSPYLNDSTVWDMKIKTHTLTMVNRCQLWFKPFCENLFSFGGFCQEVALNMIVRCF